MLAAVAVGAVSATIALATMKIRAVIRVSFVPRAVIRVSFVPVDRGRDRLGLGGDEHPVGL
jgi:hypothetical protein